MMIDPESYYELYLEGKSAKEIQSAIDELKEHMTELKTSMEDPDYHSGILPSEKTILSCNRLYLERAIQALIEAGGVYKPSDEEIRADEFNSNIPFISQLTLSISEYRSPYHQTVIIKFDENDQPVREFISYNVLMPDVEDDPFYIYEEIDSREMFSEALLKLHMGEWLPEYDGERFGFATEDGDHWTLDIEYDNGREPAGFSGSNDYPYNFDDLLEFLGIQWDLYPAQDDPEDEEMTEEDDDDNISCEERLLSQYAYT